MQYSSRKRSNFRPTYKQRKRPENQGKG
ncbi:hypothetical protein CTAM01_12089 [Colletotrichum tamarilloi]|uniref:Mating type protein 1-2-1 n=1 Tax=Colletotrichum tamarilloi TaxID=1209934 RepID=A0ABQ9QVM6_9PEZI|nr:hypothetical protein CTAM01_12089 [Colletotrichum tamarilloi]